MLLTPSVTMTETCARSGRVACMAVARFRPVAVEVPAQLEVTCGKEKPATAGKNRRRRRGRAGRGESRGRALIES